MLPRPTALAALGSLLLAAPALADRGGDAPLKAPTTLKTHHVAFTLPGDGWLQEINVFGGPKGYGHYRLVTKVASGGDCTLTPTVLAKSRRTPLHASHGKVALSATDTLTIRRQGRHGAVRWWAGRRGGSDTSVVGSQRLPARLVKGGRRFLEYRVTILHASEQPADFDACYALGRALSIDIAQTLHIASGPPVSRAPFVDGSGS
jgi:hypothetical protein